MADVSFKAFVGVNADQAVAAPLGVHGGLRLMGVFARESAGTAAVASFNVCNGAPAAAAMVVPYEIAADQSTRDWFGPDGIACPSGISLDVTAGTVDVVIAYKHADRVAP